MEFFHQISHYLYKKFGKKVVKIVDNKIVVDLGFINHTEFTATINGTYDVSIIDSNGINYNKEIIDIIALLNDENKEINETDVYKYQLPKNILVEFLERRTDSAGFDSDISENEEEFDLEEDPFWIDLRKVATLDRKLKIYTYGNRYKQYTYWNTIVQRSFNALVINSAKARNVDLRNIRGTHVQLQKAVRRGSNFENVVNNIVNRVETENLHTIGVYCRAGHHRSVAIAEMLKKYVYVGSVINHLTINR